MNRPSSTIRAWGIAVVLAALSSPGCFWAPELTGIRRDLESQLPGASFDKDIELSFGPVMLTFARVLTSVIPGADEARPWLHGVSRVQIGVYDAHVGSTAELQMPEHLKSLLDLGWETAMRVRDDDEAVWLLYHPDGDKVREIFVVVLNDDELVIVKARGRLERIVAAALDEAHGRHSFTENPGG
jgi:hypothetical protein